MVGDQSPAALRKLMDGLLGATQAMEARTRMLEDELCRSSCEVKELKSKLDDVRKESLTDPLTAIPNRKLFDVALEHASTMRTKRVRISRSACAISTISRRSTTHGGIRPATRCCGWWALA
jgi:hypothetical protein